MKAVSVLILGAGSRGFEYAKCSRKKDIPLKIVGVAEPRDEYRKRFMETFQPEFCFRSWEEALSNPRMAEGVIITTPDKMHAEPAILALKLGYHVLVEKPMATTPEECRLMAELSIKYKKIFAVCHVLRYTPFFRKLKEMMPVIGEPVSVEHIEKVGYWHMAHSFVRGNWRRSGDSSPMILAKSCHDMDILRWLIDRPCQRVASFGSLLHFRKENAPPGSTKRCLEGCKAEARCPYSALKLYLNTPNTGWPVDVITTDFSQEGRLKALKEGPYGRCVYHCDNDVVDHQIAGMEFEGGITASLTMSAFTKEVSQRKITVMGTMGELIGDSRYIQHHDFRTGKSVDIDTAADPEVLNSLHYGGDEGLIRDFVKAVREYAFISSSVAASLDSHLMAFGAEMSRETGQIVTINN